MNSRDRYPDFDLKKRKEKLLGPTLTMNIKFNSFSRLSKKSLIFEDPTQHGTDQGLLLWQHWAGFTEAHRQQLKDNATNITHQGAFTGPGEYNRICEKKSIMKPFDYRGSFT